MNKLKEKLMKCKHSIHKNIKLKSQKISEHYNKIMKYHKDKILNLKFIYNNFNKIQQI